MKAGFRTWVPTSWFSGKDKAQGGITWCQEVSKHMNTPMKVTTQDLWACSWGSGRERGLLNGGTSIIKADLG